jgi:hypothetical protein
MFISAGSMYCSSQSRINTSIREIAYLVIVIRFRIPVAAPAPAPPLAAPFRVVYPLLRDNIRQSPHVTTNLKDMADSGRRKSGIPAARRTPINGTSRAPTWTPPAPKLFCKGSYHRSAHVSLRKTTRKLSNHSQSLECLLKAILLATAPASSAAASAVIVHKILPGFRNKRRIFVLLRENARTSTNIMVTFSSVNLFSAQSTRKLHVNRKKLRSIEFYMNIRMCTM